jgi:hypothetical protein
MTPNIPMTAKEANLFPAQSDVKYCGCNWRSKAKTDITPTTLRYNTWTLYTKYYTQYSQGTVQNIKVTDFGTTLTLFFNSTYRLAIKSIVNTGYITSAESQRYPSKIQGQPNMINLLWMTVEHVISCRAQHTELHQEVNIY